MRIAIDMLRRSLMASALPSLRRIEVTSSIKDKLSPTQSTLMEMETKIIHYPLTGITLSKQSCFIFRERTGWKGVQVIPAMAIHSVEMSIDSAFIGSYWDSGCKLDLEHQNPVWKGTQHGATREIPMKGNEDGEKTAASLLWGKADKSGTVHPGDGWGRSHQ